MAWRLGAGDRGVGGVRGVGAEAEMNVTSHICPKCGGTHWIGVQYAGSAEDYDGISEWQCETCGARYGRWSKRELQGHAIERRYGGPVMKPAQKAETCGFTIRERPETRGG